MNPAVLSIVGHTTATKSRIFAAFDDQTATVARVAFRAVGSKAVSTLDVKLSSAPPYRLASFDLAGLPAGAPVEYSVAAAATAAALPAGDSLFATKPPPASGGTFRTLPVPNQRPPRLALVSCNGVFTAPEKSRYRLWTALKQQIDAGNVDLILFAGDQIYADPIWMKYDGQDTLRKMNPQAAQELLTEEYRNWYLKSWSVPEVQAVLGSCPSVMMWDDHDIYDGYGSHDDDQGASAQMFFGAAKQAFTEFQVSHNPPPLGPSSFAFAFDYADVGVLVLVLGANQLHLIDQYLAGLAAKKLKYLHVVAGVPMVHAPVAAALGLFQIVPGTEEAEDDLRDSWASPNNLGEARQLLLMLFNFAKASGTQVSILSGDVHVATVAAIESSLPAHRGAHGPARIHQIVSSGIGYMPPTGMAANLIKKGIALVDGCIKLAGKDIVGQLLPFQGSGDRYLLARRNFAIVKMSDSSGNAWDAHRNLWVDYHCEEGDAVVVREQCLMPTA
jgi:PhoD-like phosphatase